MEKEQERERENWPSDTRWSRRRIRRRRGALRRRRKRLRLRGRSRSRRRRGRWWCSRWLADRRPGPSGPEPRAPLSSPPPSFSERLIGEERESVKGFGSVWAALSSSTFSVKRCRLGQFFWHLGLFVCTCKVILSPFFFFFYLFIYLFFFK